MGSSPFRLEARILPAQTLTEKRPPGVVHLNPAPGVSEVNERNLVSSGSLLRGFTVEHCAASETVSYHRRRERERERKPRRKPALGGPLDDGVRGDENEITRKPR